MKAPINYNNVGCTWINLSQSKDQLNLCFLIFNFIQDRLEGRQIRVRASVDLYINLMNSQLEVRLMVIMEYNTHFLPDAYCPCCKWALGQDCQHCSGQSCPPPGSTGPASSFPSPDLSSFKWSLLVSLPWSHSGKTELTARGTWCDSTESLAASGSSASLTWPFSYRQRC